MIFRQLMEFNPQHSWAVTYNQMWNLAMTNPIGSTFNFNQRRSFDGNQSSNSQSGNNFSSNNSSSKRKLDYCWSFNKGLKCKFGKRCKFMKRCSYCNAQSHGVVNCDKLDGNKEITDQKRKYKSS